jgi:chemotaxis protein CheX
MRAELINPFLSAANNVFNTMLGCRLTRQALALKTEHSTMHEVSGLIGLSGTLRGMVVVNLARETALRAAAVLLGSEPRELDAEVMDAIGELTNMIAGSAKTQLERYDLSMGLPTIIVGENQTIMFPSGATPIIIPFTSEIGPLCIQVGLVELRRTQPPSSVVCESGSV